MPCLVKNLFCLSTSFGKITHILAPVKFYMAPKVTIFLWTNFRG